MYIRHPLKQASFSSFVSEPRRSDATVFRVSNKLPYLVGIKAGQVEDLGRISQKYGSCFVSAVSIFKISPTILCSSFVCVFK